MMAHMAASGIDFAFDTGDLAESGASYADTRNYYLDRVAKYLGQTVPWFNAWGNHDTSSSSAIIRRFADMPSKDRPGYTPGFGSFYFTYADCLFIAIDYSDQGVITSGWLESLLQSEVNQNARFTILGTHVPPYCEMWIDGNSTLRSNLVPLMEAVRRRRLHQRPHARVRTRLQERRPLRDHRRRELARPARAARLRLALHHRRRLQQSSRRLGQGEFLRRARRARADPRRPGQRVRQVRHHRRPPDGEDARFQRGRLVHRRAGRVRVRRHGGRERSAAVRQRSAGRVGGDLGDALQRLPGRRRQRRRRRRRAVLLADLRSGLAPGGRRRHAFGRARRGRPRRERLRRSRDGRGRTVRRDHAGDHRRRPRRRPWPGATSSTTTRPSTTPAKAARTTTPSPRTRSRCCPAKRPRWPTTRATPAASTASWSTSPSPAGTITAADFQFKVGNNNDPEHWTALAVTPTVSVRPGEGDFGSDRVTIIFPDGAIQKQWLQVTVLGPAQTRAWPRRTSSTSATRSASRATASSTPWSTPPTPWPPGTTSTPVGPGGDHRRGGLQPRRARESRRHGPGAPQRDLAVDRLAADRDAGGPGRGGFGRHGGRGGPDGVPSDVRAASFRPAHWPPSKPPSTRRPPGASGGDWLPFREWMASRPYWSPSESTR